MVRIVSEVTDICSHCGGVLSSQNPKCKAKCNFNGVKRSYDLCENCLDRFYEMVDAFTVTGADRFHRKLDDIEYIKRRDKKNE